MVASALGEAIVAIGGLGLDAAARAQVVGEDAARPAIAVSSVVRVVADRPADRTNERRHIFALRGWIAPCCPTAARYN